MSAQSSREAVQRHELAVDARLASLVLGLLRDTAFERRDRWAFAVVVVRVEERRVTSRGDFAQWLRANDLRAASHECTVRRVPSGAILTWVEVDHPDLAAAGFIVANLETAGRAAATSGTAHSERFARLRLAAMAHSLWLPKKASRAEVAAAIAALSAGERKATFEQRFASIPETP